MLPQVINSSPGRPGAKVTNIANPVAEKDAANKQYVDSRTTWIEW